MAGQLVGYFGDSASGPLYRAPRQWHQLDLTQFGVTNDAVWAEFSAHMIITDLTPDIENLTLTMRPVGSSYNHGNYQAQSVSVFYGDGQRDRQVVGTVKCVDGKVEVYWDWTSAGVPDTGASTSLISLWLNKWGRWVDALAGDHPVDPPATQTIVVPSGGLTLNFVPEDLAS
jgi:hypothetical protein